MPCPVNRYSSYAQCKRYLADRPLNLPLAPYRAGNGCLVTFSTGYNRTYSKTTWLFRVTGCAGMDPPLIALREALMRDCQARGIAPGSATLKPLQLTPDSDPTTEYARLLRGEQVIEPYPVAKMAAPDPAPVMMTAPPIPVSQEVPQVIAPQLPGGGGSVVPTPVITTQVPSPTIGAPTGGPSAGIWDVITGAVGGLITGGPAGAVVGGLAGAGIGGGETPTSGGVNVTGYGITGANPCPTGYEWRNGRCEKVGLVGTVQRWIPGGATGTTQPVQTGMMGAMGAVAPHVEAQPRSYCPTGYVLGRDGMCYDKRVIPNRLRKYPKGRRPLLTGGEMRVLSKAKTLEKKVQRAWSAAGKPGQRRCRSK